MAHKCSPIAQTPHFCSLRRPRRQTGTASTDSWRLTAFRRDCQSPGQRLGIPTTLLQETFSPTLLSAAARPHTELSAHALTAHISSTLRAAWQRPLTGNALCCALDDPAPTPRTPTLASRTLPRSNAHLRRPHGFGLGCVGRLLKGSARGLLFRKSRATCLFVRLPLVHAAGLFRRALGGAAAGTSIRRAIAGAGRASRAPQAAAVPQSRQRGDALVAPRPRRVSRTRRRL